MSTRSDFRTLGILWLVYGCWRAVEVAALVVYSSTITLMWGALLNRVPNPLTLMTLFHIAFVLAVAWIVISAFFSFVTGAALLRESSSAYVDSIVAGLLALPDLPFGVILGVFTLATMLPRDPATVGIASPAPPLARPVGAHTR